MNSSDNTSSTDKLEQAAPAVENENTGKPAILIPPAERKVSPKARKISRLLGTLITVTIIGVVAYQEFTTDKESNRSAAKEQISPEELIARLERLFTNSLMGAKPAAVKHLQGDEYGIWLDQTSGEADIKTTYDRKKNKWMFKGVFSQAAKDKMFEIRKQNLIGFLTGKLGRKPYKVVNTGKNQFEVWMDPDKKGFTLTCDTKTQTWRGVTDDDQALFDLQKNLKQAD